ncbi:metal-dependent hydrolase family protein [Shimia sp. Alg240-R146]|uniref:metal-dependent hydrolase family protein n=1 Tax=Shimia sp. Alg240-R146 TaxID=2993449 RepID=UPI0022E12977|nr:amidohydrolase family protein [Shimia sp. Alg240-R146]
MKFLWTTAFCLIGSAAAAQNDTQAILITNIHLFDGVSAARLENANVLIDGHIISRVSTDEIQADGATVIDGQGGTLMPGLVDNHVHLSMVTVSIPDLLFGEPTYPLVRAVRDAEEMLMRGVTTGRDMGGNIFGLKKAIDEDIVPGPRIYPSGRFLSQTSGHFDFRTKAETHRAFSNIEPTPDRLGWVYTVDGVPQVLAAARENLRLGASQIKIAAGGGYASPTDPLLSTQFTFEEMKAAADAATDFGTYVTMHAYTPTAINRAIDAGIKDVGHGQLLDRETLERMAAEGVHLSTQPFTVCNEPQLDAFSNAKLNVVCQGTANMYKMVSEMPDLNVTWGTDLFNVPDASDQVEQLERLLEWFEPVEILKQATGNATSLLAMSGDKNPYPEGPIGRIVEGAYADLLIVEGNPLADLSAVTDASNIMLIMKNGVVYKDVLN